MESQNKASLPVMHGDESRIANRRGARTSDLLLRLLALVLTLAAAIVLGVNKQTKLVPIKIVDTLPTVNVPAYAKWRYLSAFVNGAALAIGLMGYQGNSHVRWNKVCDVFSKFCNQAAVSLALSLLASIVFLFLVAIASLRLQKKSK
ncbi:unnamed protein product [Dovyalis caffra]|uniref:CASP-like protein n=1 Tax=Dovyalis caffra TaxID=77055 RepID=A0AAV1RF25_9ROSI|nr:unnamed protein product [Dovyalis caffra]